MAQNEIEEMLDHLRRIKSEGDQSSSKIDLIEILEMVLGSLRTFIKYHHVLLPDSLVKITKDAKLIVEMFYSVFGGLPDECKTNLNVEGLESQLLEFIEGNTSSMCNFEPNDSDLSEYMDCLRKNLNDVLKWVEMDRSHVSPANEQIPRMNRFIKQVIIIQKKMRFLRYLYATEINGYVDHEKLECLETRILFMANNVGQFCLAFLVKNYKDEDEDDIWDKPPYLLCLIVLVELEMKKIFLGELKASKITQSKTFKDKKLPKRFSHHLHNLLMYLRKKNLENAATDVPARNIDVAIEFLLVFLDDVPNHLINGKWLNEVLEKLGDLVGDVLQKLLPSSIIKNDASKINLCSIQIVEKIEDLKAQVEERYKSLKYSPSQFPTVGGLSFLDSLLRKLNEMLKSESSLDFMMKPHICILEKELSSLTSVFRDVTMVQHKHDEILKDLQRRTINLAYEAEVAIDSILAQYNALWHLFCSLPTILKEIKHISAEVTKMWSENLSFKPCYVVESSKHLPTRHSNPVNDGEIVGFEIAADKLILYLTRGTSELDVIPIVGMGGQGKTTCARKLYNNGSIVHHFDVRAWCIVSQTYNRRKLLQEIFSQVTGSKDKGDEVGELADMLRKSLMGKRYLIVLDDMWDGMAWDDLRLSFPDVGNRSRIVVTTRLEKVAKLFKDHTDPYSLPFLKPHESLKLLQKKVFQQENCPPGLQDVSVAVAERCKGLPLAVVLVAGIIKKRKMEASWWHEVKNSLFSYLGESEDYSLSTMQLSYDNLPDYLKPCLLYMGMFREDARIPVSKLISLWIAEGFVQNIESGILEEAAEGYLMDLISSNVVMVSKREYNGKVKSCLVHDVVLHFCLEKSREEKFMLAVKGHRSQFQVSQWNESRVSFSVSNELSKVASVGSKTRKPFHQHLRSLIINNQGEFYNWNLFPQVIEVRLLKVLDLISCSVISAFSSATFKPLIHLKYLAVATIEFDFHPELHLPHLETLILNCYCPPSLIRLHRSRLAHHCFLPAIFWKMEKLRHVRITEAVFVLENHKQQIFEEFSKLENLKILGDVLISNRDVDSMDVLLQRCPNLQELYITFDDDDDTLEICLKLESLTHLQILGLSSKYPLVLSGLHSVYPPLVLSGLHLPSSLKKLILTGITISFISELPSLEYLKLSELYFIQSEEWCLGDITFHKLKFLKLEEVRISRWDASEESFPLLETLVIKRCIKLKEIPLSFVEIPTLKQIKLIWCENKSLETSAVRIKKAVEDIEGCDRIDITIKDLRRS